ncbi:putative quinol monooxygenase [Cohnella nanjingensis]|uniref:Antibiotic biosynthesis monooxygenase n=1 Tax=Cohnella nanjingensis TaxID=1387779 RepID=A0A7X0RN58_9BACL|nr:antibiotic biosynthesis monooxygenase [Cohnella nanjingensis]MBB6670461.1 antibiotic biosynthesis monooxygenase [Cohnella nanjingensis]
MSKYGMYVKFTAIAGGRDALAAILMEAAAGMDGVDGCEIYLVNVSETEPETVWVTEVWRDAEAHQASLRAEGASEMIGRARPLISGVEQIKLSTLGGKGV